MAGPDINQHDDQLGLAAAPGASARGFLMSRELGRRMRPRLAPAHRINIRILVTLIWGTAGDTFSHVPDEVANDHLQAKQKSTLDGAVR